MGKPKKSKKRLWKEPSGTSEKKAAKKKGQKAKRMMVTEQAAEPELGNNAEKVITPEEMSYIEDTGKPEPTSIFDAQDFVANFLRKHGQ